MGSKCKVIIIIISVVVILITLILALSKTTIKGENYTKKLINALNDTGEVKVQDIFSFEFKCAYVFNDCYISGQGFAKRYNLNIEISQVESGVSESIHRIVFVDENGDFVYEFKYNSNQLNAYEEGMIIYPNTVFKKCDSAIKGAITFEILSSNYYG